MIADQFNLSLLEYFSLQKVIEQIPNEVFDENIFDKVINIIDGNKEYKQIVLDSFLMPKTVKVGSVVTSVAFSPNRQWLASGSLDKTIKIWDTTTWKELETLRGHPVTSVVFNKEGTLLASGSWDGTIKIWDTTTWKELETLKGHTNSIVTAIAFNSDGTLLAGSSDTIIKVWRVYAWEIENILRDHMTNIDSVEFSPDGRLFASGSLHGIIKIWDTKTWQELTTLLTSDVFSIAFSSDGKLLASGSRDGSIRIWDTHTWEKVLLWSRSQIASITSVAFSPDGKWLASGSKDKTINIWDTRTWQKLETLKVENEVTSISCSPSGKWLASGLVDGTIKIWPIISLGTNESIPISQILFLLYIFQNEAHKDWKLTPEQAKTLLSSYETLSDEQKKMVSTDIVQKLYELRDQKFEQKMEIDD